MCGLDYTQEAGEQSSELRLLGVQGRPFHCVFLTLACPPSSPSCHPATRQVSTTIISGLEGHGSLLVGLPISPPPPLHRPFTVREQMGLLKQCRGDHTPLAKQHHNAFSIKIRFDFLAWHPRPLAVSPHSQYVQPPLPETHTS